VKLCDINCSGLVFLRHTILAETLTLSLLILFLLLTQFYCWF